MGQEGLVVTPQQKPEANIFTFSGPTKGRAFLILFWDIAWSGRYLGGKGQHMSPCSDVGYSWIWLFFI